VCDASHGASLSQFRASPRLVLVAERCSNASVVTMGGEPGPGEQVELNWVCWDIAGPNEWAGRPSRLDSSGALVYAHPASRRDYTAGGPRGSWFTAGTPGEVLWNLPSVRCPRLLMAHRREAVPSSAFAHACASGLAVRPRSASQRGNLHSTAPGAEPRGQTEGGWTVASERVREK
jgi:hypothetical protein